MDDELTPAEVLALHRRGEVQLVDVRTPAEHTAGRIEGDVHIELGELPQRAAELDPGVPIVFYCRSGARSGMATAAFRASGFAARNMTGGLIAWSAAGLPMVPEGAVVADH